jgi:hypothetical protein
VRELFGVELATGSVDAILQSVGETLAEPRDPAQRQLCWAHLVRDFTAHSEGLAAQKQFGEAGLTITTRLFAAIKYHRRFANNLLKRWPALCSHAAGGTTPFLNRKQPQKRLSPVAMTAYACCEAA